MQIRNGAGPTRRAVAAKAPPERLAERLRSQTARCGEALRETGFTVEEAR